MEAESKSDYSVGYGDRAIATMRMRRAEHCCDFFREHVKVDSDILDCGCGPGSVTIGLAQWAPEGKAVGIDIGAEPLEVARGLAQKLKVNNITFEQASVFDLPFPDGGFDIVFAQTLFIHIPDHEKALSEMRRVLRPGGLIALRDGIHTATISWPDHPVIQEVARLHCLHEKKSGGNPDAGRQLGTLLTQAGFSDVFVTLSFTQPETPEHRAAYFNGMATFVAGDFGSNAIKEGWITEQRLSQVAARLRAMANEPEAVHVMPYGQAVGRK